MIFNEKYFRQKATRKKTGTPDIYHRACHARQINQGTPPGAAFSSQAENRQHVNAAEAAP